MTKRKAVERLKRTVLLGAVILVVFASPSMARQTTLQNVEKTLHGAPAGASDSQIAAAIKVAGSDLGWIVAAEQAGTMQLRLKLRSHMALVSVGFDATHYWIQYEDSENLSYRAEDIVKKRPKVRPKVIKGPVIHHNYNNWIRNLSRKIQERVGRIPSN